MSTLSTALQTADKGDNQALTGSLFVVIVLITVGITFWASRNNKTAADYYAGGRSFTGVQNGFAVSGDYMSAASFLGISGAIALSGYDGFLYSIGFLVAWLVALLLVAELLRNSGRFTMADQLAFRMRQRPVRTAAATSTVVVSIFYLLAQMVGAGALVALLLGVSSDTAKNLTIAGVGALMIFYVVVGGMRGTTWVQIVKAVLLMGGTILITVLVLAKFNFNLSDLLGTAAEESGVGKAFLEPGLKYGVSTESKIDFISLGLALVLGTAGLPHILIRFYTVPSARQARKSVLWAIGLIGSFYLMTLVLGFGAAALVKGDAKQDIADSGGNLASPVAGGSSRWRCGLDRRRGAAGPHLGGGVRHDPRSRRRAHAHLGIVGRARSLRQCLEPRRRHREAGGQSCSHCRVRHRRCCDRCCRFPHRSSTSPSWWRWRSRSRPRPTSRRCSTTCSGSGSTPAERCGASTADSFRASV